MPPDADPFDPTTWKPGDRVRHPGTPIAIGSIHVLGPRIHGPAPGWELEGLIADDDAFCVAHLSDRAARDYGWERVDG